MRDRLIRMLIGAVVVAVLGLVFVGYLRPEFVVDLANRIVLCF